jgi:hypothetical protein
LLLASLQVHNFFRSRTDAFLAFFVAILKKYNDDQDESNKADPAEHTKKDFDAVLHGDGSVYF